MSRRRNQASGITVIYWRDIPAQIKAIASNGQNDKIILEARFQHAIDRAAHVAGLTETHKYIEQWRRVTTAVEDDPITTAQSMAPQIQHDYPQDRLERLVRNGGLELQ